MPQLPHNQRAIDGLGVQDGKRTTYWSQVVTGLILEVMPSGKRTWRVRYRTSGGRKGKTRAFTIGDASVIKLGTAVDKARAVVSAVQVEQRDPQAERSSTATGKTFDTLFNDWLERHAKLKKRTWANDEWMYHRYVQSLIGQVEFNTIRRSDVAAVLDEIAGRGAGTQANRVQALLSTVFNWAINEGLLESSPIVRLPKRGVETPRERVLTEAELRAFWNGLSDGPLGATMARVLRLALLTGQRRSEIAEVRKAELDLTASDPCWTISGSRTKNGIIHRVPLTATAVSIFTAAVAESRSEFAFAGRGMIDAAIDPDAVTRAMARMTRHLGMLNATVHDLRRTVGTNLARLGVSRDIRARVLNHIEGARSITDGGRAPTGLAGRDQDRDRGREP